MSASILEQGVLVFLIILSVVSWAVSLLKVRTLNRMKRNHESFQAAFSEATHTGEVMERGRPAAGISLLYTVFSAGIQGVRPAREETVDALQLAAGHIPLKTSKNIDERVRLAMEHALKADLGRLNNHLPIIATAGSASPFIGLFGTVWGILATFQTLGTAKSASLQVLAPPIAAALVATGAGLAVAIPAVMFYNWIISRLDRDQEAAECLIERMLHLLRATGALDEAPAAAPVLKASPKPRPEHGFNVVPEMAGSAKGERL